MYRHCEMHVYIDILFYELKKVFVSFKISLHPKMKLKMFLLQTKADFQLNNLKKTK